MAIEIRQTQPDEYRLAAGAMASALLFPAPNDEKWERSRSSWDEAFSLSAWDGEHCVGHAAQFFVDTTVPGGARLASAAVSRVGVLPTARRQGVATGLLHGLIYDAADRGLAMMSLRASEATIYERFGFGLAGEFAEATLDPRRARPIRGADASGSFRLLAADEIMDVIPPLYDRVAHRRPGAVTRPLPWMVRYFDPAVRGETSARVVVHTDAAGNDDGYALYTTKWDEDNGVEPTGKGEVNELFAATEAAELALWQFICDVDLVTSWTIDERPVDDVLRFASADYRAYRLRRVDDEQWVRLVDVGAALAGRTYRPVGHSVTIEVTDPVLPRNSGRWRVSASGAERVDEDAPVDLVTSIEGLSAAYLGGTSWYTLVATERATAVTSDAARRADDLFAVTPLPVCGSFF